MYTYIYIYIYIYIIDLQRYTYIYIYIHDHDPGALSIRVVLVRRGVEGVRADAEGAHPDLVRKLDREELRVHHEGRPPGVPRHLAEEEEERVHVHRRRCAHQREGLVDQHGELGQAPQQTANGHRLRAEDELGCLKRRVGVQGRVEQPEEHVGFPRRPVHLHHEHVDGLLDLRVPDAVAEELADHVRPRIHGAVDRRVHRHGGRLRRPEDERERLL